MAAFRGRSFMAVLDRVMASASDLGKDWEWRVPEEQANNHRQSPPLYRRSHSSGRFRAHDRIVYRCGGSAGLVLRPPITGRRRTILPVYPAPTGCGKAGLQAPDADR